LVEFQGVQNETVCPFSLRYGSSVVGRDHRIRRQPDDHLAATARLTSIRSMPDKKSAGEADRARVVRHLRELIAALDRRVPRVEHAGETAIARDAATLRAKALERIAQLEATSGDR
jgi:hypothetical protein